MADFASDNVLKDVDLCKDADAIENVHSKDSPNRSNEHAELSQCLVCPSTYKRKPFLIRHLSKIHHLTNLCQICYFDHSLLKPFANPVSLRNHKLRDHPEDMVKCVCGAMFIDQKTLATHLKKFKCHMQSNTGETFENEMVKCVCGKRFGSNNLIEAHKDKCRKRHLYDKEYPGKKEPDNCEELPDMNGNNRFNSTMQFFNVKTRERIQSLTKCKVELEKYNDYSMYSSLLVDHKGFKEQGSTVKHESGLINSPTLVSAGYTNNKGCTGSIIKSVSPSPTKKTTKTSTVSYNAHMHQEQQTSAVDVNNNQLHPNSDPNDNLLSGSGAKMPARLRSKMAARIKTEDFMVAESKAGSTSSTVEKGKNATTTETAKVTKKPKRLIPDAEGRYPCKKCKQRYKRPYLYVHQKYAHAKKVLMWVPKKVGISFLKLYNVKTAIDKHGRSIFEKVTSKTF